MQNLNHHQNFKNQQDANFSFVRECKFSRILPSKEELKHSFLEAGVTSIIEYKDFIKMNFKIKNDSISAQTLLRRFGDGTRSSKNLAHLFSWIGLISKYNTNIYDYSDPAIIKAILLNSKINLQTIKFKEFIKKEICTDKFIGTGRELIIEFQKSVINKVKKNEEIPAEISRYVKKLRSNQGSYVPLRSSFETMLEISGIINHNYSSIRYKPALLRKILESSGVDFDNWFVSIVDFYKMRFKSKELRDLDRRNQGTISGQALAKRFYGTNALRNEHIREILITAGYKPKRVFFPSEIKDPKILSQIIKSCRQNVDFTNIKFKDFQKLEFNSKYFIGKGHTLLKWYGKVCATTMKELLSKVGIPNSAPLSWKKRIGRLKKNS
ncbi:MAG: hypothetical protein QXF07_02255 [Candidatus Micrarchaeia archaeon]